MYTVYILKCEKNGRYYTGSTEDLWERLSRHNGGETLSARGGIPWRVEHIEILETRSAAMKKEKEIRARGAGRCVTDLKSGHTLES